MRRSRSDSSASGTRFGLPPGARGAFTRCPTMLLAQPQQLDVFEGVAEGTGFARRQPALGRRLLQPLHRAGGGDAAREREDARGVDKGHAPAHLEIDALDAGLVRGRLQLAEPAERRAVGQRVVGHLFQESGIGARALRDVGAQRVRELRLAPQWSEVEKDARGKEADGIAAVDPVLERGFPFVEARAPARIHRHHAAFAQRIPAVRERFVDRARERQEPLAECFGRRAGLAGDKDEAVVLVGGDGLLVAAFRTHPQPA